MERKRCKCGRLTQKSGLYWFCDQCTKYFYSLFRKRKQVECRNVSKGTCQSMKGYRGKNEFDWLSKGEVAYYIDQLGDLNLDRCCSACQMGPMTDTIRKTEPIIKREKTDDQSLDEKFNMIQEQLNALHSQIKDLTIKMILIATKIEKLPEKVPVAYSMQETFPSQQSYSLQQSYSPQQSYPQTTSQQSYQPQQSYPSQQIYPQTTSQLPTGLFLLQEIQKAQQQAQENQKLIEAKQGLKRTYATMDISQSLSQDVIEKKPRYQ